MGWLFNVRVNWGPGSQDRFPSCLELVALAASGAPGKAVMTPASSRAPGESGAPPAEGTAPVPGGAGAPRSPTPQRQGDTSPFFIHLLFKTLLLFQAQIHQVSVLAWPPGNCTASPLEGEGPLAQPSLPHPLSRGQALRTLLCFCNSSSFCHRSLSHFPCSLNGSKLSLMFH